MYIDLFVRLSSDLSKMTPSTFGTFSDLWLGSPALNRDPHHIVQDPKDHTLGPQKDILVQSGLRSRPTECVQDHRLFHHSAPISGSKLEKTKLVNGISGVAHFGSSDSRCVCRRRGTDSPGLDTHTLDAVALKTVDVYKSEQIKKHSRTSCRDQIHNIFHKNITPKP